MARIISFVLAFTLMGASIAIAGDKLSVAAYYPEGPIISGGKIYFAEMHRDRIDIVDEGERRVFYERDGCGPTAIAPYSSGFVVLCHLAGQLHIISITGVLLKNIQSDASGVRFTNPNDASADDAGGVYFTISGSFSLDAPAEGQLLYLSEDCGVRRLANGLHYANGAYFDSARRTVFVSEHLAQRILAYPVLSPGELGPPRIFAEIPASALEKRIRYELAGPDGLETDANGYLYVAYYGAGLVLILSPDGDIAGRVDVREKLTTNIALSEDGRSIFATGSKISRHKPFPGKLRELNNPLSPPK